MDAASALLARGGLARLRYRTLRRTLKPAYCIGDRVPVPALLVIGAQCLTQPAYERLARMPSLRVFPGGLWLCYQDNINDVVGVGGEEKWANEHVIDWLFLPFDPDSIGENVLHLARIDAFWTIIRFLRNKRHFDH